jgi:hypothetical protein
MFGPSRETFDRKCLKVRNPVPKLFCLVFCVPNWNLVTPIRALGHRLSTSLRKTLGLWKSWIHLSEGI